MPPARITAFTARPLLFAEPVRNSNGEIAYVAQYSRENEILTFPIARNTAIHSRKGS